MIERTPEYLAALERTKRGMASFKKPPPIRRNTVGFYPPTPRLRRVIDAAAKRLLDPLDLICDLTTPLPEPRKGGRGGEARLEIRRRVESLNRVERRRAWNQRHGQSDAELTTAWRLEHEHEDPVWTLLPVLVMDTSLGCLMCGSIDVDFYPESLWCVSCVGKTLAEQERLASDFVQDREVITPAVGVQHVRGRNIPPAPATRRAAMAEALKTRPIRVPTGIPDPILAAYTKPVRVERVPMDQGVYEDILAKLARSSGAQPSG